MYVENVSLDTHCYLLNKIKFLYTLKSNEIGFIIKAMSKQRILVNYGISYDEVILK